MSQSHEANTVPGRRPSQPDPLLGTWLDGRFLIEERIATGGFGAIYRGRTRGGLPIALKVLHPALLHDANMVARFQRECAILTQLHDPHTVTTLAVGESAEGMLYIAMELLAGESLHDRLQRDRVLPWQTAVAIARAVCSSLAEAHALGVVHRDLKPANIHVETRDGAEHVKVIDFGIVKIAPGSEIDDGQELTFAGHMIGTCDYMSPEQIVGGACGGASDIYSLGVVLYEMLTGRRPFARITSPAAMMTALLTQTPQPPSVLVAIPPALDRVVMRCLEREPEQRFAGVIELAATLGRVLAARPTQREEITAVHPVWDPSRDDSPTIDDGMLRAGSEIESEAGAAPSGIGPRDATRGGVNEPALPVQRGQESPLSIDLRERSTFHETPTHPVDRRDTPAGLADGTGQVSRSPEVEPRVRPTPRHAAIVAAPRNTPTSPLSATLQGLAVRTERPSRPGPIAPPPPSSPHPPPAPSSAPAGSSVLPMPWQRPPSPPPMPPPGIRCEPLARGSSPTLPGRSHAGLLWVALVAVCVAAIVFALAGC